MVNHQQHKSSPSLIVSIIIPCYNMGRYLDDALDSVNSQTYKEYEVIVVNDGSTDLKTLIKLETLNRKIQVINQKNMGLPAARNAGVDRATGGLITCLDADDVLRPKYLELCVKEFVKDESGALGFVGVYTRLFEARNELWKPLNFNPVELLRLNFFHSATMFRKSAWARVAGYNEEMRKGYEDWDFWIKLVEHGYKWSVIKKELTGYRIRENSMVVQSNKLHTELYGAILDNHPAMLDRYGKDLIIELMATVAEKDALLENRVSMIAILEEKLKLSQNIIEELHVQNQKLSTELAEFRRQLTHYQTQFSFRAAKKIGLIRKVEEK